ncbi:MAG: hypothetical protein L6Q81_15920 [Bacteroidia bacterium]|nr:hypothetical protein [Bacteroidia bacterium]
MRRIVLLAACLLSYALHGQKIVWNSFVDYGTRINAKQTSSDGNGNLYVAGEYEGELLFGSERKDTAITKYCSSNWHKSYVVRYNSWGKPTMVVQFKSTGSNSDLTYITAIKALPTGECLIAVDARSHFDFIGPTGIHAKSTKMNQGDNLFCINADGTLKWSASFNVGNINILESAPDGTIYLHGSFGRYYAMDNCLMTLSANGSPLDTVRLNGGRIQSMRVTEKEIFVCALQPSTGPWYDRKAPHYFDLQNDNFGLFRINRITMKAEKLFEISSPMRQGYERPSPQYFRGEFNSIDGNLFYDVIIPTEYGATTFLDKRYTKEEGAVHLIRLNTKGEGVLDRGIMSGSSDVSLFSLGNGNVAISCTAYGRAFHFGSDSLVLNEYGPYVYETVVMKLDRNFNKVWWFCAGGASSYNRHTQVAAGAGGRLFITSVLMSESEVLGRKQNFRWRGGMYVMEIAQ